MLDKIRYHHRVPFDLDNATEFYEPRSPQSANRFRSGLNALLTELAENPSHHAITYDDVRIARIPKFPYTVHYRIEDNGIKVMGVFHASAKPKIWHERD